MTQSEIVVARDSKKCIKCSYTNWLQIQSK